MENLKLDFARLHQNTVRCVIAWIDNMRAPGVPEMAWEPDLGNARLCLIEALVKIDAEVDPPAVVGADAVVDNNAAGRAEEKVNYPLPTKPVKFSEVPEGVRASVLETMVMAAQNGGLKVTWGNAQELQVAIDNGYEPGNHFSFTQLPSGSIAVSMQ